MKTRKLVFILSIAAIWLGLVPQSTTAQVATLRTDAWMTNGTVNDIEFSNGITYIGGDFTAVFMPSGNGTVLSTRTALPFSLPRVNGEINAVIPDGAGGWYVGGNFTSVDMVDSLTSRRLVHILANGTLDRAWKPTPNSRVLALALRGDTLYVGGDFTKIGEQSIQKLAALKATTGQVVTNWNPNPAGQVRALAVDGPILYAGGSFNKIGDDTRNRIAAINAVDGKATPWNPDIAGNQVNAIAVSGTTVYVGGRFTQVGTELRKNIAAINAVNGNSILSWNPNAEDGAPEASVQALAVSGSTVYVGGNFKKIGKRSSSLPINLAALKVTTGEVTNWRADANKQVNALALNGSTIYVGGKFTTIGGKTQNRIAAIDTSTMTSEVISTTWNPDLAIASSSSDTVISALAVNGLTVYAGGNFSINVTLKRNRLAAFNASTGRPTSWNPDITSGVVRALAVSGSRVYAGGSFLKTVNAFTGINKLAAFRTANGKLIEAWNPNPDGDINAIDVAGATVYAGGSFSGIGIGNKRQSRTNMNVAALDSTDGNPSETWNTPSFRRPIVSASPAPVRALIVQGSVLYVGGHFTAIGGIERNFLSALNATTGDLDTTWAPKIGSSSSSTDTVLALAVSGSTIYAGGRFTTVNGLTRNSIVAINSASGIPLTTWDPNVQSIAGNSTTNGLVRSITIDGSVVYIGGVFNRVKGEPRMNAANVKLADGNFLGWAPLLTDGADVSVNAIEVGGETIFAGGNFTKVNGASHSFFAPIGKTPQNPVPILFSVSPAIGKRLQTLNVNFDGQNFIDDFISVNAGDGIAVNSVTFINSTNLTANITISERATAGMHNFSVTNNPSGGGTSSSVPFLINNPVPTAANLNPANGPQAKILDVEIMGSNFISGVTKVSIGPDITVNSITVTSVTRLTANITIHENTALGRHDVSVINASPGGGTATLVFTVNYPRPTLTGISPASGNQLQTLNVVCTGTSFFDKVTTVNAGSGITVNSITVTSPTSLTANLTISTNAAIGPRVFSLTNGQPGEASENRTFTVNNPVPALTSLIPASGGRGQTLNVVLIGANFFNGVSTVSFGADITVDSIKVNSDTQITAKISIPFSVAMSSRAVSVTNAGPGGGTAILPNGFSIVNPNPTLTRVTPTIGGLNQTLEVELSGTRFINEVSRVDFGGGIKLEQVTVVSPTQITAKIFIEAWAPVSVRDVSVINAEPGGGAATISRVFAVSADPVVQFSVPLDQHGAAGDTVKIPLNINPNGRKVGSFDARLNFNPQVLEYLGSVREEPILRGTWNINVNSGSGAVNIGAYMSDTALTEAGTALTLRFRVQNTATRGTTVRLMLNHLAATNFNAVALPVDGEHGLFTVPNEAKINGKLFYFSDGKPLTGDTLQLEIVDPEIRFAVSDANGQFKFTEIPLGNEVLLMPRRVAGNFPKKPFTAGDALTAFKCRTGGPDTTLTAYARLAADVNGDCQINSGDALAILKRCTESLKNFRRFGQDDWRFVDADFKITKENWCIAPNRRTYTPIRDDQSEQNFVGVLLGDVDGSFDAAFEKTAVNENMRVAIKHQTAAGPTNVQIALEVNAGDERYNSFDLTLLFDAAKLRVVEVEWGNLLTATDWQADWNASANGVLRLAGFSLNAAAIQGRGNLLIIHATLASPAREEETLQIEMPSALFGWNGKEILAPAAMANLSFTAQPQKFALEQNFPNPFVRQNRTSATTIAYALPKPEMVTLRIYDMLGNTVRTLISRPQEIGHYTVTWNGRKDNGVPAVSGVYFYRLEAGAFTQTHKLILQR